MAPSHAHPDDSAPTGGTAIAPGIRVPDSALRFSFSRASGPGGQNVNKVSTRAELRIDLDAIPLPPRAKARLRTLAGSRIVGAQTAIEELEDGRTREVTRGGELIITSGEHRSQSQNKSECMDRLRELLIEAMHEPKHRRATKPSRGSIERRITEKKSRGEIKKRRSGGDHD
jgi:ribosome-associated protein